MYNIYTYTNVKTVNIATWEMIEDVDTLVSGIHYEVIESYLNKKDLHYCRWDSDTKILQIEIGTVLSTEEKTSLDIIIGNNIN